MFTLNHFIFLAISIIIIIGMLLLQKIFKIPHKTIITILFVVSIVSELIKIFSNMITIDKNGKLYAAHLDPGDLPFHLCSIQIFFIFALKYFIKNKDSEEKLLGFMAPSMLLGGVMALLIPTVGVKFTKPQVWQFFIFHSFIIFFSIYILKEKLINWTWKTFIRNLGYLGIMTLGATWINSILSIGFEKANFMYLSRPPMENLPILNLNNGWHMYFISLASITIFLLFVFHLIMILIDKKANSNISK